MSRTVLRETFGGPEVLEVRRIAEPQVESCRVVYDGDALMGGVS